LQTTLLGIAIAIILALVAALVGPLLIDWGAYRPLIEAEASRIVGSDVHVAGAIDGRLLPSPRLTLHDVSIGQGPQSARADELDLQFALTPLMRGNWQAEQVRVAGPQLTFGIDANGKLQAPALAAGLDPDAVSIDRLQVEGGTVTLKNAGGEAVTLHGLFFNGKARSLAGPFSGSGAFMVGDESYTIEDFSAGRVNEGALKLRVALQPGDHPFKIEGEGTLNLVQGKPRFDGSLNLAPPPGLAQARGKNAKPWHVSGKLTSSANSALLQNLEFVYGGDAQALKLTGSVRLNFGKAPSLSAELNTPRLDLDRLLADADGKPPAPAAALRELAQWSGGAAFVSAIPVSIGLSVDEAVLGGGSLLKLGGDFNSIDGGWNLAKLEFRAPGFSQVTLSGRLAVGGKGVAFTGPAVIDAGDPKALFAWLEGRADAGAGDARPLSLRGNVTLGTEKVAIDDLAASFDDKPVRGRIAYRFASGRRHAKLDAALSADDIDLDTALGFGKAMLAGSHVDVPQEIALKADLKRARLGGFSGRDANIDLTYDDGGLQIANLSVADLGGASFAAMGRIRFGASGQQGSLSADLSAPDMKPVVTVLSRLVPEAANWLQPDKLSPAKLHAVFSLGQGNAGEAKLALAGDLGRAHLSLDSDGRVDLTQRQFGDVRVAGKIGAADGRMLVSMLHLDRVFAVGAGPGTLALNASGRADGPMLVDLDLGAPGLKASVTGRADLFGAPRSAALRIDLAEANIAPLQAMSGQGALPVNWRGSLALKGDDLTLSGIRAELGSAKLSGNLSLKIGEPMHVGGDLEADSMDAPAVLAAATGMAQGKPSSRGPWAWSSEPFAPRLIDLFAGDVALKAHRVALASALGVRELQVKLHFGAGEIAAQDASAAFAGGRLAGNIAVRKGADGLQMQGKLTVSGADATRLIGGGARPPLSGTLGGELSFEGSGLSPVALVGSLHGTGKVMLQDGQLAGLDPHAFDAVTHAVDAGLPIEPARISDVVGKALASGQLRVRHADGALALAAGQVRLEKVKAAGDDADLSISGALDLTDGVVDAHLVLSGMGEAAGTRPDIYMALKGPLGGPERSIDVSALTGWLTLRSVENQARKLKSLEEAAAKERAMREKADAERTAKLRAEQERRAREAAANAQPPATPTVQPKTFPPLSPPPVITVPPPSKTEAISNNERAAPLASSRTEALPPAPPRDADAAPVLPPPVSIERLPGALRPTHP
jgi:uncharacterized protein involved in outer membrane biogenesis